MIWFLEPVTGPDIEPVSLAEMRLHLNCYEDQTDDNDRIEALIQSAREWVEDFTGRACIDQALRLSIDKRAGAVSPLDNPARTGSLATGEVTQIYLRRSPVLAISSFVVVDSDGEETAVDTDTYDLCEPDSKWPRLVAKGSATWPSASRLRIAYRAGFADRVGSPQEGASVVPQRLRQAIMLHAEAFYDRDPAMMDKLLKAAENLARGERCHMGFA